MSAVKATVFDWAGTMVDFGSRAPMGVFVEVFRRFGVEITVAEARAPMGLPKLDHIKTLGAQPRIHAAWKQAHGTAFDDRAANEIYEVFVPLNTEVVMEYADLVPGASHVVALLRERDIKVGSTTGYTREIMAPLLDCAKAQGYEPDNLVCSGDLAAGRPTPLGMFKCFVDLGVWEPERCIKVDDTAPGLKEGLAAGMWTVGVSLSGNEVGLSYHELQSAPPERIRSMNEQAKAKLKASGAHFVIDTVADLMPVVDLIEGKIESGESPRT